MFLIYSPVCSHQMGHCKLITRSQGTFLTNSTCLSGLSLFLGTRGNRKEKCQGDEKTFHIYKDSIDRESTTVRDSQFFTYTIIIEQSPNAVHHVYAILRYICSITDTEHSLVMNVALSQILSTIYECSKLYYYYYI